MRGLKTLLVERNDYSTGATGRNHGLMHSGGRYAVTDAESAAECIAENKVLRRIASHCIEPTDGLFISLPDDDLQYQHSFVQACQQAGIDAQVIDPDESITPDELVTRISRRQIHLNRIDRARTIIAHATAFGLIKKLAVNNQYTLTTSDLTTPVNNPLTLPPHP